MTTPHSNGFLSSNFLVEKKGGGSRLVLKLRNFNAWIVALQDGGHPSSGGYPSRGRLDGAFRFKECVLDCPSLFPSLSFSSVSVARALQRIQSPSLWPLLCTVMFHKDYEAGVRAPSGEGSALDRLPR